jgi:hypothetical protein
MIEKLESRGSGAPRPTDLILLPTHLVGWVVPHTRRGLLVEGGLCCSCGSNRFELRYTADPTKDSTMLPRPSTVKFEGVFHYIVAARCADCGRQQVLFDKTCHGLFGFFRDSAKAAPPRPPLWQMRCHNCEGTSYAAEVGIVLQPEDSYFNTEYERLAGPEHWPDAFGCFRLAIRCHSCGRETPEWVIAETA